MSAQPQPENSSAPPQLRRVSNLTLASSKGGGSGSPILKVLIAFLIVAAAIGAYVFFNEKPAVAVGEVLHLDTYSVHHDSKGDLFASQSVGKADTSFNQIIVIADVRLRNQSSGPLFLSDMAAVLTLPAEEQRSLAAGASNYNRVFEAYPDLASMKQTPLLRDITIPAGATVEGQLIFNYPITKEQWDQRKSLDLNISFTHRNDLIIHAPQ
jgi:hypothetical protein